MIFMFLAIWYFLYAQYRMDVSSLDPQMLCDSCCCIHTNTGSTKLRNNLREFVKLTSS